MPSLKTMTTAALSERADWCAEMFYATGNRDYLTRWKQCEDERKSRNG